MQSDIHYIETKKASDSYNFPLVPLGGNIIKEERIRQLIPDMQKGRWYFPHCLIYVDSEGRRFDLIKELIEGEFATFPKSRYDDVSDCLSRVYSPDLFLTFPMPKQTLRQKTINDMIHEEETYSWENF